MKARLEQQEAHVIHPALEMAKEILHEQLALRRLKELALRARAQEEKNALERIRALGLGLKGAFTALFHRVELVREEGPGLRPLERHEWEKPYIQYQRML